MVPRRPLGRPASYADLEALPPGVKGEIIDGELHVQPRPRARHMNAATALGGELRGPFQRGRGGPGGFWILVEPGIELPGSPEVSPDVAGWRRERLPVLPADTSIAVVPDWVCEILSPSNRAYDLRVKLPFYARVGVSWLWLVDPAARVVQIRKLVGGHWSEIAVFADDEKVRAEPFGEVEIELGEL